MKVYTNKLSVNERDYTLYSEELLDSDKMIQLAETGEYMPQNATQLLRIMYKDHGELYEKEFNVERKLARLAGWDPDGSSFSLESPGFKKFVFDHGKVRVKFTATAITSGSSK